MVITRTMFSLLHWLAHRRQSRFTAGALLGAVLLLPLALAACNDAPPPTDAALNQLHWCGNQTLLFQDASQSPPTQLTDWNQVKAALDFTIYLPKQLPIGTCLVAGEALIHDKVLGSNFGVSYTLPDKTALAFSETAVTGQQPAIFQCTPSNGAPSLTPTTTPAASATPTPTPDTGNTAATQLCLGAKGKTNVVIDSSETEKTLQTTFDNLQANVDWIPKK